MLPTIISRCQPLLFAPLAQAQVEQLLATHAPEVEDASRAARYSGGSVVGALQAAQALALLSEGEFGSVTAPGNVAAGLSRTAAVARKEAQAVLDVVIQALHNAWSSAQGPRRETLQQLLGKFENYKRSIARNVSPALVIETALMSLDGLDVKI